MPALHNFEENIGYAQSLLGMASAVDSLTTSALDVSDLHRAALVMAVSSLDHYVHERIRELVLLKYAAGSLGSDVLEKITVPLKSVVDGLSNPGSLSWLDAGIRASHQYKTFQRANAISEVYKLVTTTKIWQAVGLSLGIPSVDVQRDLNLIVDRRNKIAHEADLNPLTLTKWPMSRVDAQSALALIEKIARALDPIT